MGGRGILGSSPAQRMARLFSSSRGRHSDPDKVAAGPNQAPRGPAAIPTRSKVANKPKGERSRKIPASVSPGRRFGDYQARQARAVGDSRPVRRLPAESALIDGEAVAFRPDGHSDIAALRT